MKRTDVTALVAGLVFAIGLGLAGMTQPAKVLAFLDVTGAWDPSLALVMAGAVGVHFVSVRVASAGGKPRFADRYALPVAASVDRRLLAGAALFGAGWGIAGYCPGPAVVSVAAFAPGALAFVGAMLVGMWLFSLLDRSASAAAVSAACETDT